MAIEPVTREERFLAAAGGQSVTTPTPITRKEQLLQGIIDAVKSGGATPDVIEGAVNDYLNANPVKPGATTEQAAQIEQNKTDIADLQTEVNELKESGGAEFTNHVGNLNSGALYKGLYNLGDHITAPTKAYYGSVLAFRAKPNTSYVYTATGNMVFQFGQADYNGIVTQAITSRDADMPATSLSLSQDGGLGKYRRFKTNERFTDDSAYLLIICNDPAALIFEGDSIEGYELLGAYSPLNGLSTSDNLVVRRKNLSDDIITAMHNADTAVQPEDFEAEKLKYFDTYNDGIINIDANSSSRPVGYSAHITIRELANTAEVSAQFLRNQTRLDFEGRYAHCPAVVVIGNTAYIAAFMNTEGGDRYDVVTAKTMLYVVDIPTMVQTGEHVVAENGSIAGELNFPLGSGACTCVVLGDIIRINFVAKLSDDQWHQLYRDYNPTDNTWGDIGFCKILDDGAEYDFTTANVSAHIQKIPGSVADDGLTINTNIVGQHTVINGVYYVGIGARDQWANMPILKTVDWVTFEHFATPTVEGNDAHFEMAVASNGVNTLYTATRQKKADKLVLMKINANTGAVTASAEIADGNRSRPYICKNGEWLYVAHILTVNRSNSSQITVLRANTLAFERCLTLPPMVYPAFAAYNGGIFATYMVPYRLCATKFTAFEPYGTLDAISGFAHMMRMTRQ